MNKKHTLDDFYFDEIDTEQKAYLLGLFTADGWVNGSTKSLCLSSIDKELITTVRREMGSSAPIYMREKREAHHSQSYQVTLSSWYLCQSLVRHGVVPNKSLTVKYPKTVPLLLQHHYIRGYFDGDGGVWLDKRNNLRVSVVGTKSTLTGICRHLATKDPRFVNKVIKAHGAIFKVTFDGIQSSKAFAKIIYDGATVFLKRKKAVFDKVQPRYKGCK